MSWVVEWRNEATYDGKVSPDEVWNYDSRGSASRRYDGARRRLVAEVEDICAQRGVDPVRTAIYRAQVLGAQDRDLVEITIHHPLGQEKPGRYSPVTVRLRREGKVPE